MTNLNIFAGFDISKDSFDLSILLAGNHTRSAKFSNDLTGFVQLKSVLPVQAHCIMEATGPYYLRLACWLHKAGFTVSVVNPLVIRRFAQMQLRRVKTDKADASIIAEYGYMQQPKAWTPPARYIVKLQQLDALKQQMITMLTALNNQLEAFTAGGMMDKEIKTFTTRMITQQQKDWKFLNKRLKPSSKNIICRCSTILPAYLALPKKQRQLLSRRQQDLPGSRMQSSCVHM